MWFIQGHELNNYWRGHLKPRVEDSSLEIFCLHITQIISSFATKLNYLEINFHFNPAPICTFQLGIIIHSTSGLPYLHWGLSTQLVEAPCQGTGHFQEPDPDPSAFVPLSLKCSITTWDRTKASRQKTAMGNLESPLQNKWLLWSESSTWRLTEKVPEFPCVKTSSPITSSLLWIKFWCRPPLRLHIPKRQTQHTFSSGQG